MSKRIYITENDPNLDREFWLSWCDDAQTSLGALLADTIDKTPSKNDAIRDCVNKLIEVEQNLAAILGR